MDCVVEVRAYESTQWGYAGGACEIIINTISGLTKTNGINGRISGGDLIGRTMQAVAVFHGAKKNTKYKASYEVSGGGGDGTDSSIFVVCYPA